MESDRPSFKSTIHGHPVYCDDEDARYYLRHLDDAEAGAIFRYAKTRGRTDFEIKKHSTRYNYHMTYDDGAYIVEAEGAERHGWF